MTTEDRSGKAGPDRIDGAIERELDAFFAAARPAPVLSPELETRFLLAAADVAADRDGTPARPVVASVAVAVAAPARARRRSRPLGPAARIAHPAFLRSVGGWPGLTGMASAAMAGLWLGFAAPDSFAGALAPDSLTGVVAGSGGSTSWTIGDLMPSYDPSYDTADASLGQ